MKYKNYNRNNEDKLIMLANNLLIHIPQKIVGDKYYNVISKSVIEEICCKNKSVMYAIRNRNTLCLEDYRELLYAVGFMLFDYCKARLAGFCEQVIAEYKDYSFSVDKDFQSESEKQIAPAEKNELRKHLIIDMMMGRIDGKGIKWSLKSGNGEIMIVRYKPNKQSKWSMCRGKDDTYDVSGARVVQIGLLKMFISDINKKVYCLSTTDEYLLVKKCYDNSYIFYEIAI